MASEDGKLWVMPALLEVFGFSSVLKAYDTFDAGKPWHVWVGYAAAGTVMITGGVVWAVFRKKIADLWPQRQLRIAKAELLTLSAAKAELEQSLTLEKKQTASLRAQLELFNRLPTDSKPSKLKVIVANYATRTGAGRRDDVTEALRCKIAGDSLVQEVQNANFWAGNDNLVPTDPCDGEKKRLEVEYSYEGMTYKIDRSEGFRLVLPEEKAGLLSSLQVEALILAKDLRDFYASLGPYPSDPTPNPGEDNSQYLVRFNEVRTVQVGAWQQRLSHGFSNRKFGQKITELIHRAGEECNIEHPALLSNWAAIAPPLSAHGIPKLAQELEMIAIWINRKERGEVDLLDLDTR
jgi:hypothetical protein